jgi:hypothetical protein
MLGVDKIDLLQFLSVMLSISPVLYRGVTLFSHKEIDNDERRYSWKIQQQESQQ